MRIFFFFLFIFFLFPFNAQAIGVAVDPAQLDVFYSGTKKIDLKISNISKEPENISIFPDDLSEYIKVQPKEFILNPEQVTVVKIFLNFTDKKSGVKKTNLSVISKALNKSSFNAASGIKIPLTITISDEKQQWNAGSIFIAVFVSLLFIAMVVQFIFILLHFPKKRRYFMLNFLRYHKKRFRFFHKLFK